jgi:hypothetical protein
MTTNFITPPDFVEDPNYNILLVDVDPVDIETLAYLCAGHTEAFNIYMYKEDLDDILWFNDCVTRADAIIVNTENNSFSTIKDRLADLDKTFYYGSKRFLNNPRQCQTVLDFFVNRANERKHTSDTL